MAGPIQVGDIIKFSEMAWTVWNYGWASEHNAGENYRAFGTDVSTLHHGLRRLDEAVNNVQTSLREYGARDSDILGGDKASLAEIIGDYNKTLNDCHHLLVKNRRYDQTTGPAKNIEWNINITPQVEHLRGRIQMHNARIEHLLRPFQIDLINKIHRDLVRRLTSLHTDVLGLRRDIHTLLKKYYPDVAREIEEQSEQELHTVIIPDDLLDRMETMLERRSSRRVDQPLTLTELTDCFLIHFGKSTVNFQPGPERTINFPPLPSYIELLKCQLIMNKIKASNELQNPPRISHWPGYVDALEEKLSQQCSRFRTELVAPDTSNCEDELLAFWPEDEQRIRKPSQSLGPPYEFLLEVPLATELDATIWKTLQLSRRIGSDHHFRILQQRGHIDQPPIEEPAVVDFDSHTTTLIPIYADPVDKDGALPPLEIILEHNYKSHQYVFLDMNDVFAFQEAITGFKVVTSYMEPHAVAVFVRPGQEQSFKENVTVQLWIPSSNKGLSDRGSGMDQRRDSSASHALARPSLDSPTRTNSIVSGQSTTALSYTSWGSSGSDETISIRVDGAPANTGYGMIRPTPRNPLLVLFTRDSETARRSIVAIKIDDETRPNPERCNCQKSRECRIAALEQRRGRFSSLRAQRLEQRAKWNLLPLLTAPSWTGLLRVSVLFPTAEARHKFSGGYCECRILTESDLDACLLSSHQGLLGMLRVYYRRQMIMWQEQRDKQREVDKRPPPGFSSDSPFQSHG